MEHPEARGVSIVICCHNSAPRLPDTLRHLAAVQVPVEIAWEVLVVDNASTDETAGIAAQTWPAAGPAPLRVVREPVPGLSNARRCGIREARLPIISFIDDDNWVAPDWIVRVQAIFAQHPEVGACGGRSEAVCETPAPAWFESCHGFFAVGSQHPQPGDVTEVQGTILWGAGLNVRTPAARNLLEQGFHFLNEGRRGNALTAGEDVEFILALRKCGWRIWYDDGLMLRHFLPTGRLQWPYVLRLLQGMGRSSPVLRLYLHALNAAPFDHYPQWKKTWWFQCAATLRRAVLILLRHPGECLLHPEGSHVALQYRELKGELQTLWQLRGRYAEIQSGIEQAPWARGTGAPGQG
jgi:glycosyltransferase involved in cell wall biosynthesis